MLEEKARLLAAAGAELHPPEAHCDLRGRGAGQADGNGGEAPGAAQHPLRAGSYSLVVCHMLKGDLAEALKAQGWDPEQPTIWVACEEGEGLGGWVGVGGAPAGSWLVECGGGWSFGGGLRRGARALLRGPAEGGRAQDLA